MLLEEHHEAYRADVRRFMDRVVEPAILFYGPFIFLVVILILIIREFRAWRRRVFMRSWGYPPRP